VASGVSTRSVRRRALRPIDRPRSRRQRGCEPSVPDDDASSSDDMSPSGSLRAISQR
jgi:hypothetical protein